MNTNQGDDMGREVRRVPPDWEHPTDFHGRYIEASEAEHGRDVAVATLSEQLDEERTKPESEDVAALRDRVRTLEAEIPHGHVKLREGEVVPVLGWFWRTKDGAIIARSDAIVYVCEGLDGYTRWSGKVVQMLFCNYLNKSDSGWGGNPTPSAKFSAPDGGWHCWSTREAAEAAIAARAARAATGPIGGEA